jgi:hypothetical protein
MSRPAFQAGFVAFVIGGIAQWWSLRTGAVFAFWDAQAHLDIARRVVDSTTPGLQMLGTVWLPIPHLLMLPFTLVDAWWWSGLAGGIVGLAAFVCLVASLHGMLVRRTDTRTAWIGTAFVVLNPSLLYLQTTAMTEPVLLAFLVGSAAAIDRWNESGNRRTLLLAGALAALSIGSRYDGWFFAALAAPTVAWLSWRSGRRWLVDALLFSLPGLLMGAAWLGFNWLFFDDPLEFQRGVWSAQAQAAALGVLPTRGHLLESLKVYLGASLLSSGAALTVLGLLAVPIAGRRITASAPALLLLSVLPFNILALVAGQSTIQLPWGGHPGILNLRYGVMMLPGLAAAMALGISRLAESRPEWRRGTQLAAMTAVAAQLALFGTGWPSNVGALREGLAIRDGDRRQQEASDWLAGHYDGGRVLVDEAVNLSPRTRIPMRDRIYDWTWQLGADALATPEVAVDWVVVDRRHVAGKVLHAIDGRAAFADRFDRAFAQDGLEIWRRR